MEKKRILICDDDPDTLDVLQMALPRIAPVEVIPLQSGSELLDYFSPDREKPDLLIIDLVLLDMEGDDIIQHLRKDQQLKNLPIILMSGVIVNVDDRARAVGADTFLKKPFSFPELETKVLKLLHS